MRWVDTGDASDKRNQKEPLLGRGEHKHQQQMNGIEDARSPPGGVAVSWLPVPADRPVDGKRRCDHSHGRGFRPVSRAPTWRTGSHSPLPESHMKKGSWTSVSGAVDSSFRLSKRSSKPLSSGVSCHPSRMGKSTPSPKTNNHTAGAGVPTGRTRRCSRAAFRGSRSNHRVKWRSNSRNTKAVVAP